jgi:hypothetical protein
MPQLTQNEIDSILSGIESKERSSDLGYFSKPFRVYQDDKAFFIKLYIPVKSAALVSSIIINHDEYVNELKYAGLKVPDTKILSRIIGKEHQLVIIQDSFRDDELLRNCIIKADLKELTSLCTLVFDDIIQFRNKRKKSIDIGFHPTLRNYAVHEGNLWFFDTFPPMLMKQNDLNALIIKMSPHGGLIKKVIPPRSINKVTDEYYRPDRMFTGIVGSCCRLRPDDVDKILSFSREYFNQSAGLSSPEKENILKLLKKPPDLPKIWILIRKLSGNVGKPNINTPISA